MNRGKRRGERLVYVVAELFVVIELGLHLDLADQGDRGVVRGEGQ